MDYVPKNKLLKQEFEKIDKSDYRVESTAQKFENGMAETLQQQIGAPKTKSGLPTQSQSLQQGVRRPAKQMKIPAPKLSQKLQKDIAEDQELRNFMSKYDTWDQDGDADDIFSAADQLLGMAMQDLTYTGGANLENPYKRSAKAQEP